MCRFAPEFSASFLYGSKDLPSVLGMDGFSGSKDPKSGGSSAVKQKKFTSVACQTVSTGDIIATQLYQDS